MTCISGLPLAQGTHGLVRTTFEWGRIQSNTDWILPMLVLTVIFVIVCAMYLLDAVELHPLLAWFLIVLRSVAFIGLLIIYLQPQWRTEREVVRNSRAVLLVDTSLSMGLTDAESPASDPPRSRIRQVAAALSETDFLAQIRETHDVAVVQFNETLDQDRVWLPKLSTGLPAGNPHGENESESPGDTRRSMHDEPINWDEFLKPGGTQTQIGTSLRELINDESGSPVSGIVLISDGGQNAGVSPQAAIDLAGKARLPIFSVGIGSASKPANVRVADLVGPARAYPGDSYVITGFVQAQGLAGEVVEAQLLSGDPDGGGRIVGRQQVTLGGDREVVPVKFELTPQESGVHAFRFLVRSPERDRNSADDFDEVEVEIVDRKNRVLMFAGGPMREYRFLRNQLYRDNSTTIDVLLQSGRPGISQDADKILDDFPATREEMFQYDCLLAFDPDWQDLSDEQIDHLEKWVGEQGGGLIVIGGAVFVGNIIGGWVEDQRMKTIRALYPVEFHRRVSVMEAGMQSTEEPWPLDFTREGLEAEFLWLDDTATAARRAWAGFEGVYSYCPVRGPKPGATVLARFSDPRTGRGDQRPVYFATQFYGSGRVFYLGSGEMWRLRKLDEAYFEQFYTKLLRHVSQGRLLRGSDRGVLLVGQDRYLLGSSVEVRAQLTNAQLNPLESASVDLQVFCESDGSVQTVTLQADPGRTGTFAGRFPALDKGNYRLELLIPESDDERLSRRIKVTLPSPETENPQRNDALLSMIAKGTGGKYYVGMDAVLDTAGAESILEKLPDRSRTDIIPQAPDPLWEENWLKWIMIVLCTLLCIEWLIRRLVKLA